MGGHLAISDLLVGLFFHLTVHLAFHGLIHLLLALAVLLLLQGHDVALALGDDLRSALACLVDLLDDLYRDKRRKRVRWISVMAH